MKSNWSIYRACLGISVVLTMTTLAACGSKEHGQDNHQKYVGTFVHATLDGKQLREISLPDGVIRRYLDFPIAGTGPGIIGRGGLSDCHGFLLTTLSVPGNETGVFAVDMSSKSARFVRQGQWPTCGPNNELFFYWNEPGSWRISLFAATVKNPGRARKLIDGGYAGSQELVFVERKYLATYDPSIEAQVVFDLASPGVKKVWTGDNCRPLFWRTKTRELVCIDPDYKLRSQKLMGKPGQTLLDTSKLDIGGVLHYWPTADAILAVKRRGDFSGREYQDLVALDLMDLKVTTLLRGTNIDVACFTRVGAKTF